MQFGGVLAHLGLGLMAQVTYLHIVGVGDAVQWTVGAFLGARVTLAKGRVPQVEGLLEVALGVVQVEQLVGVGQGFGVGNAVLPAQFHDQDGQVIDMGGVLQQAVVAFGYFGFLEFGGGDIALLIVCLDGYIAQRGQGLDVLDSGFHKLLPFSGIAGLECGDFCTPFAYTTAPDRFQSGADSM